jgi:hypothetical protein
MPAYRISSAREYSGLKIHASIARLPTARHQSQTAVAHRSWIHNKLSIGSRTELVKKLLSPAV